MESTSCKWENFHAWDVGSISFNMSSYCVGTSDFCNAEHAMRGDDRAGVAQAMAHKYLSVPYYYYYCYYYY